MPKPSFFMLKRGVMALSVAWIMTIVGCGDSSSGGAAGCLEGQTIQNGLCVPDPNENGGCGALETLIDGACVGLADLCGAGAVFEEATRRCVPDLTVTCGENTEEMDGTCVGSEATTCGDGTVLVGNVCVLEDTMVCPPATTWVDGACVATSELCADGTDFEEGACVPAAACDPGEVQVEGQCRPLDELCGEGTSPDIATNTCVSDSTITCGQGTVLVDGACVPEGEIACDEDSDCPEGERCVGDVCAGAPLECGPGLYFDATSGQCRIGTPLPGSCEGEPTVLSTPIEEDTVLTAGSCYRVTTTINVNAVLTIEAGTTLVFDQNAGLAIRASGSLITLGTIDAPIVMTGSEQTPGFWRGVIFGDSRNAANVLENVEIAYAGAALGNAYTNLGARPAGVSFGASSRATLRRVLIRDGSAHGLYVNNSAELLAVETSRFVRNALGAAEVPADAVGRFDAQTSFSDVADIPWDFKANCDSDAMCSEGLCASNDALPDEPNHCTRACDPNGDGSDCMAGTVCAQQPGDGGQCVSRALIAPDDVGSFVGDGRTATERVIIRNATTVEDDQTWAPLLPVTATDFTVASALILPFGVDVAFNEDGSMLVRDGVLTLHGSDMAPVVMRGVEGVPGYWSGLTLHSDQAGSDGNVLDRLILTDAGGPPGNALTNIGVRSAALNLTERSVDVEIRNSVIANNDAYGLYIADERLNATVTETTFRDNALGAASIPANQGHAFDTTNTFVDDNREDTVLEEPVVVRGGIITDDQTWGDAVPFFIADHIDVEAALTLNNAELQFDDCALVVTSEGRLDARLAWLYGAQDVPGSWDGLLFIDSFADNTLDSVDISHAGSAFPNQYNNQGAQRGAVQLVGTSRLEVETTVIRDTDAPGIYTNSPDAELTVTRSDFFNNSGGAAALHGNATGGLTNNRFCERYTVASRAPGELTPYRCEGVDDHFVHVLASSITSDQTWARDVPWLLDGIVEVTNNATLIIDANNTFRLPNDESLDVDFFPTLTFAESAGLAVNGGYLRQEGGVQLLLTSELPIAGHWYGLLYTNSFDASRNVLANVLFAYAGRQWSNAWGNRGAGSAPLHLLDNSFVALGIVDFFEWRSPGSNALIWTRDDLQAECLPVFALRVREFDEEGTVLLVNTNNTLDDVPIVGGVYSSEQSLCASSL